VILRPHPMLLTLRPGPAPMSGVLESELAGAEGAVEFVGWEKVAPLQFRFAVDVDWVAYLGRLARWGTAL
jgi:hypothetical protein